MKAIELKIGNYVWDDYSGEMIVTGISKPNGLNEALSLKKQNGLPEGSYVCESIQPIPLTEELLLRFGFIVGNLKNCYFKHWGENGVESIVFEYHYKGGFEYELGSNKFKVIQYVHQLQNLYFALTGNELTIK